MEGIISSWSKKSRNGRIRVEGDRELNFKFKQVVGCESLQPQHIRQGLRVSFETDAAGKVVSVTLIDTVAKRALHVAAGEGAEILPIPSPRNYEHRIRFFNPYNFVRNIRTPRPEQENVLGDCPPPPHDRYVGLTGRITCSLRTVTPLFVSDSHDIRIQPGNDGEGNPIDKEHPSYRFFTIPGKRGRPEPAIPGSSLRGMLRSVFELSTNSCFSVFDGDRILDRREGPRYGNKIKENPGIIRKLASQDKSGEVELCSAASIGCYHPSDEHLKNALDSRGGIDAWKTGDRVAARASRVGKGPQRRYIVREFAEIIDRLSPLEAGEVVIEGWLKITRRGEGTLKKSEALFLDTEKHGSSGRLAFDISQQNEYNNVLQSQIERKQLPVQVSDNKLQVGDLVWVDVVGSGDKRRVHRLARVQIPRTPYAYPIGEFLEEHLKHCSDYNRLCPACRLFGWVTKAGGGADSDPNKRMAYAGRLHFSHAELETDSFSCYQEIPLAVLSSPQPTKCGFYLLDSNGRPKAPVDYNAPFAARLRGRKIYWHHRTTDSREYARAPFGNPGKHPVRDNQNRTVRGLLAPETEFQFTLEFENLAELELGALLWAIELEKGIYHRLGYGKPLGLGSVELNVKKLEVFNWLERLASLDQNAGRHEITEYKNSLRDEFLSEMARCYGEEFDRVLEELRTILGGPPDELPIHYPRSEEEPSEKGENFKWFEQHKDVALGLPVNDEGLKYK